MVKKLLSLSIFSLFILITSYGQETIGYSDSTDIKHLIDFRLPDWGYSNFFISSGNARLSGRHAYRLDDRFNLDNSLFAGVERDDDQLNSSFSVQPNYVMFKESEERRVNLNSLLGLAFFSDHTEINEEQKNPIQEIKQTNNSRSLQFFFTNTYSHQEYIADNYFIEGSFFGRVDFGSTYAASKLEGFPENQVRGRQRNLVAVPSISFGVGRLRNVTNVLRGIRLNERLKALSQSSLTGEEIIGASEQFTRFNSYVQTDDRFLKEFWGDMNTILNNRIDGLSPYDIFYLNDVFDENLGSRFEGYEATLGIGYSYQNLLIREEDESSVLLDRVFNISRSFQLTGTFNWYKNLSLFHQIRVSTSNNVIYPRENDDPLNWRFLSNSSANWLWLITDRYELDTSLNLNYETFSVRNNPDIDDTRVNTQLITQLSYFVINKFQITGSVNLIYNDNSRSEELRRSRNSQFTWAINGGIRYFFNRSIY